MKVVKTIVGCIVGFFLLLIVISLLVVECSKPADVTSMPTINPKAKLAEGATPATREPSLSELLQRRYALPISCTKPIFQANIASGKPPLSGWVTAMQRSASCPPFHTAKEIHDLYNNNEIRGDDKFKDKRSLITGKVYAVSKNAWGSIYIRVRAGEHFNSIQLSPTDDDIDAAKQMNKGDTVYASCIGGSMVIGTPMFKECVFF